MPELADVCAVIPVTSGMVHSSRNYSPITLDLAAIGGGIRRRAAEYGCENPPYSRPAPKAPTMSSLSNTPPTSS